MQKQKNKLGIRLNGQWKSWQTLGPGFSFHSNYLLHKTRYSQYEEYKKVFLKSCKDEEVQAELSGKICVVQLAALLQCSVDSD